ncbi:hypothetical protein Vau01_017890 [Virgisporangium aurantiacum]|uniref:Uncharacterized protein n=1 Tax=Virgisporangium aurantiacum TaxID=175570 RepID=A0A8J3Z0X7_9ACTN|nr:hypothetical protein Vau01_017890 [Virgisporangium aurantiacum]
MVTAADAGAASATTAAAAIAVVAIAASRCLRTAGDDTNTGSSYQGGGDHGTRGDGYPDPIVGWSASHLAIGAGTRVWTRCAYTHAALWPAVGRDGSAAGRAAAGVEHGRFI